MDVDSATTLKIDPAMDARAEEVRGVMITNPIFIMHGGGIPLTMTGELISGMAQDIGVYRQIIAEMLIAWRLFIHDAPRGDSGSRQNALGNLFNLMEMVEKGDIGELVRGMEALGGE